MIESVDALSSHHVTNYTSRQLITFMNNRSVPSLCLQRVSLLVKWSYTCTPVSVLAVLE